VSGYPVGRGHVIQAIRSALEPRDDVLAMWEGGAAAFDRVDEWSDIDLQVLCRDGRVEDVMEAARTAVETLSPLETAFRFPDPTRHGHSQALWSLMDASPFLIVDFVVMERGNDRDRFLQSEIHGRPVVHFDKQGDLDAEPLDAAEHAAKIRERIERHRALRRLLRPFVEKEVRRGNAAEAMAYYQAMALRPLVELLRMKHSPLRYNFHTRYVYYEFPEPVVRRLERLFYAADVSELEARCEAVLTWTEELLSELGDGPTESEIADLASREREIRASQGRV